MNYRWTIATVLFVWMTSNAYAQQWSRKTQVNKELAVAVTFSVNNKIYMCGGNGTNDLWEYDAAADTWTLRANMPAVNGRIGGIAFVVDGKAYVGLGRDSVGIVYHTDLWCYDPATNQWTAKAGFPGTGREGAGCFVVGNKAYVVGGAEVSRFNEHWQYDPATDQWTQKASYPAGPTIYPMAFSIGNKGYIACGYPGAALSKRLHEYDPATNTWVAKAPFPGTERQGGAAFVINDIAYCGLGTNLSIFTGYTDWYGYNATTNTWTNAGNFPGVVRFGAVAAVANGKGYAGMGLDENDWWEFTANTTSILSTTTASEISIYPNPTASTIALSKNINVVKGILSYSILSMTGVLVAAGVVDNDNHINVAALSSGKYFLHLTAQDKAVKYNFSFIKK